MNKKLFYILIIAVIVLGLGFRLFSISKDITAEETDFVNAATAIANTGYPIYYHSEQIPNQLALWHPPMYIHLEALIIKINSSEAFIRSLNVIAILITSILIYILCLKMIEGKKGKNIGIIASAFFLIDYYVLSSSILIDIDALSTLFVFSFIFCILLYQKEKNNIYALLAVFAFIFSLANRYPIAILVFCCLFLYFIITKETRKFTLNYFFIGMIASLSFIFMWTFYRTFIQPGNLFIFLVHNAELGSQQFQSFKLYISSFSLNIAQVIRLFTLPAILLFIFSLIHNFKKKDIFTRVILIYTLSILLLFLAIPRPAFGYPRYFLTLMPGFFILISGFLYDKLYEAKIKKEYYILGILLFLSSLILLILLSPQLTLYRNDGLIRATNLPDFIWNIICIIPIFSIFLFQKEKRKILLLIGLIAIFFSYNLYFDIRYSINDSHIKEVGNYLKENTDPSDMIVCPNAIGYYYGKRFYSNDYYKPSINNLSLGLIIKYESESLKNPEMNTEFFWGKDLFAGIYCENYTVADKNVYDSKYVVLNYLNSEMTPEKIIGDYYIYRLKD